MRRKVTNVMGNKKLSYNEIVSGRPTELMKKHNLNSQQFEQQVRMHMWGAKEEDGKKFYEEQVFTDAKRKA